MSDAVIGASMMVDGEVVAQTDLTVCGTIRGRIVVKGRLLVDSHAILEANVETHTLEVRGHITGNIHAGGAVELADSCCVIGDITAQSITISDGACFKGNLSIDAVPATP